MSKGSRQNGFVPLAKRLALVIRLVGLLLKYVADILEENGLPQGGKFFEGLPDVCRL